MPNYYDPFSVREWLAQHAQKPLSREVEDIVAGTPWADDEEEEDVTQAAKAGYELGTALAALFGTPKSLDFQAVWTVGSFYAKMSGYNTLDAGREFMTGFGQGLSGSSPKALVAGGTDGE